MPMVLPCGGISISQSALTHLFTFERQEKMKNPATRSRNQVNSFLGQTCPSCIPSFTELASLLFKQNPNHLSQESTTRRQVTLYRHPNLVWGCSKGFPMGGRPQRPDLPWAFVTRKKTYRSLALSRRLPLAYPHQNQSRIQSCLLGAPEGLSFRVWEISCHSRPP